MPSVLKLAAFIVKGGRGWRGKEGLIKEGGLIKFLNFQRGGGAY